MKTATAQSNKHISPSTAIFSGDFAKPGDGNAQIHALDRIVNRGLPSRNGNISFTTLFYKRSNYLYYRPVIVRGHDKVVLQRVGPRPRHREVIEVHSKCIEYGIFESAPLPVKDAFGANAVGVLNLEPREFLANKRIGARRNRYERRSPGTFYQFQNLFFIRFGRVIHVGPPGVEPGLHPPHGRVLPVYYGPSSADKPAHSIFPTELNIFQTRGGIFGHREAA